MKTYTHGQAHVACFTEMMTKGLDKMDPDRSRVGFSLCGCCHECNHNERFILCRNCSEETSRCICCAALLDKEPFDFSKSISSVHTIYFSHYLHYLVYNGTPDIVESCRNSLLEQDIQVDLENNNINWLLSGNRVEDFIDHIEAIQDGTCIKSKKFGGSDIVDP